MTEQEMQVTAKRLQAEHIELKPYFDRVCNKSDWKRKIDAFCRIEDAEKVIRAIAFFTATEAKITRMNDEWVRVQADGYRLGPAGDH